MRRLALVLGLAACDRVFALQHVKELIDGSVDRDAALVCDDSALDPNGDADGDSVLNGVDSCPRVANASPADEDSDAVPDACDHCPQFVAAGADVDCDGIGAACDPNDELAHDRRFFGLATGADVIPYAMTINGGMARAVFQSSATFASLRAGALTTPDGTVEAAFTVTGSDDTFTEFSIGFVNASFQTVLRFELEYFSSNWYLVIVDRGTDGPETRIGSLPAGFQVRIRGTIEGSNLRAEVSGDANETVTASVAPYTEPLQLAIWGYRDNGSSAMTLDVSYLQHVQPRPP